VGAVAAARVALHDRARDRGHLGRPQDRVNHFPVAQSVELAGGKRQQVVVADDVLRRRGAVLQERPRRVRMPAERRRSRGAHPVRTVAVAKVAGGIHVPSALCQPFDGVDVALGCGEEERVALGAGPAAKPDDDDGRYQRVPPAPRRR
jgi:hypothetical protein